MVKSSYGREVRPIGNRERRPIPEEKDTTEEFLVMDYQISSLVDKDLAEDLDRALWFSERKKMEKIKNGDPDTEIPILKVTCIAKDGSETTLYMAEKTEDTNFQINEAPKG